MRTLLFMLAAALAFSGCVDNDSSADSGSNTENNSMGGNATLQEPLHFTGNMVSIADPAGTGAVGVCAFPGSCVSHEFTVDQDGTVVELTLMSTDGTVTAAESQVLFGTDYDLFLYEGDNQIGASTNPGEDDDLVAMTLDAGTYTAQVHSWNDVDGEYVLDITFT